MSGIILNEQFDSAPLDRRLNWLNPPPHWSLRKIGPALVIEPAAATDFWQSTHYGFRADTGHFLGMKAEGDFTMVTRVTVHPRHQYDQAGLMIRVDANEWIKASVEHEVEGPAQLGVVVTHAGFSDWSLQDAPISGGTLEFRVCKHATDVTVYYRAVGAECWRLMRVAHWAASGGALLHAGIYACSPKGAGFRAEFSFLRFEENSVPAKRGTASAPDCAS